MQKKYSFYFIKPLWLIKYCVLFYQYHSHWLCAAQFCNFIIMFSFSVEFIATNFMCVLWNALILLYMFCFIRLLQCMLTTAIVIQCGRFLLLCLLYSLGSFRGFESIEKAEFVWFFIGLMETVEKQISHILHLIEAR